MSGKSFFLTKIGSKKFHNCNQQQQQQRHTYYGHTGNLQNIYGRYNYSTANLLQHGFKFTKTNSVGIKIGSFIVKKIISVKNYSKRFIIRKIETFCRSLDKNNTGFQNFGQSKRTQSSISLKTFSVKNLLPNNGDSRRGRIGETIKRGVCK